MLCLKTMESYMCSSQPGWVFHGHFPSGAVLWWVWIRLKLWIYKCGIFSHYACFVLNFYSFFSPCLPFPLQTPPFSLCGYLSPFWQLCTALTSEKKVGESGKRGKDEMFFHHPSQYLVQFTQWWVNWKSREILIRGKRQNLRLWVLSILDIRKNIYRQKIVEMSSDFLWGRSPCSDVYGTSMTSGPYWCVKSGPRPHRSSSVQDGHVGHLWVGFFPISLQAEEIAFNAILFQTEKSILFYSTCLLNLLYLWNCLKTLYLYKKWI